MKTRAKSLPINFFKQPENYCAVHSAMHRIDAGGSRELPEFFTRTMAELCYKQKELKGHVFINYFDDLTDEDSRTLRNILRVNQDGKPKSYSREYDLLQYMSLCLQFTDESYARYVADWCRKMELCFSEEEEDL